MLFYERIQYYQEEETIASVSVPKKEETKEDKDDEKQSISKKPKEEIIEPLPIVEKKESTPEEELLKNIPQDFLKQIIEKNQIFHTIKYIFNKEYFDFVIELFMQREFTENKNYNRETYEITQEIYPAQFYDHNFYFL